MKQKYSHSMIIRLLAIAVSSVGTLFLLPLILNTLGEYNFGIWGMVSSITSYLLLLDFGIALACTRYLSLRSEDRDSWTDIVSNALLLSFIIAGVMTAAGGGIFLAMQSGLLAEQQHLLGTIVIITLLEVAISIPLRMYMSLLRAEVRYFDIGLFEVIRVTLRIGGIATALLLGAELIDIVIISSITNLVFFVLPLVSTIKRHKTTFFNKKTINKKMFTDLLTFSKSTAISQAAEFLKFRTDAVLVAALIGITASAHYTIIVFIVMMLTQVLMRFLSYWDTIIINNVGQGKHEQAIEKLFKSLEIGISLSLVSLLNIIIFGKTFITLWVGESYNFLHTPLIFLTLILVSISFQMATTPYFNALGKEKTNAAIDFSEVLLKLAIIVPMSGFFDLNGFIYTNLICSTLFGIGLRVYYLSVYAETEIKHIINKIVSISTRPLIGVSVLLSFYLAINSFGATLLQSQAIILLFQAIIAAKLLHTYLPGNKFSAKTS